MKIIFLLGDHVFDSYDLSVINLSIDISRRNLAMIAIATLKVKPSHP